jgi:hypothetical protein
MPSAPPEDDGTPANLINAASDLAAIAMTGSYTLGADITLTDWTPLGSEAAPFAGSLEGKGHTITVRSFSGASVSGGACLGIFAHVNGGDAPNPASIKNIKIRSSLNQGSTMTSGQIIGLVGGIVQNAVIENITLDGTLGFESGKTLILGGVAGVLAQGGLIKNCVSDMALDIRPGNGKAEGISIADNPNGYNYIAGFAGRFEGGAGLENCHNRGDISAVSGVGGSQILAGGIANGELSMNTAYRGYIIDCSSTGNISASALGLWTFAGGIAASLAGDGGDMADDSSTTRILRCRAEGSIDISGTSSGFPYAGGITAYNYYGALVSQCRFDGTVKNRSAAYTGGIAGYNSQTADHHARVEDCWSAGTVSPGNAGIAGQNQVNAFIRRCYTLVGGGKIAGGNANPAAEADLANCRALEDGGPKPARGDWEGWGWDFGAVWKMGAEGYPRLRWE